MPDPGEREFLLEQLVASADYAGSIAPDAWTATLLQGKPEPGGRDLHPAPRLLRGWARSEAPGLLRLTSASVSRIDDRQRSVIGALTALAVSQAPPEELPDVDIAAIEGSARLVTHLRLERNRRLGEAKKEAARARGALCCEACGLNFATAYDGRGESCCEVHHRTPFAEAGGPVETALDDLAVLCSNCHRIIHRTSPMWTVEELRRVIARGRADTR